ncbi:DUF3368 domain-containing protein [Candidatus Poribacteria bacterium]|nr:DUF3368 domain-containing protein [Candidatus Poribacteria bacterium]
MLLLFRFEELDNPDSVEDYISPLSPIDAEVIVLAREQGADLILTRDRRLRRRAYREGFETMKPLTLFIGAKMRGLIPAVKPLLDEMRRKGVSIREGVYQEALRRVGEL